MKRNTFYQQIEDGLGRELDPEVFERCACGLLRAVYPSLVPIRGGGDSGMDGAIADGEGPAYPLVCTTEDDVIGNLTKSLSTYVRDGGTRRKVVLATSQALSPRRRQNLLNRAGEMGFELVQIHERADFADRLRENPAWCLELLNLTGDAPALSVEPVTSRPLTDQELTGREDDLTWLREATGDRLLVGEPGSGKTSLLRKLVQEGWGLFLVTTDIARVAPEIRSKKPRFIVVDDAHVSPDHVLRLDHLRREISGKFSIVASTWIGARSELVSSLRLGPADVRELVTLDRDQITEVVRSAGVAGPTGLIREIVNQARGRPGLAVTLAKLCLKEGTREVALGTALTRDLEGFLRKHVTQAPLEVLASFAFGGNPGMPLVGVARAYRYSIIELRGIVSDLELAGIVSDAGGGAISVWPERLRHALVRDVFFSDRVTLDYKPILDVAQRLDGVVETLIGARAVGAALPPDLLPRLLDKVGSEILWAQYAWLGPQEAAEVLSRTSSLSSRLAQAALERIPETAIQRLLDHERAFARESERQEGDAMRWLREWIARAQPGTFAAIERRRLLLAGVTVWIAKTGCNEIGFLAAALAFSPTANWSELDPGLGRTITVSTGCLDIPELERLGQLWENWIGKNRPDPRMCWRPLLELLRGWVYGNDGPLTGQVPPDIVETRRRIAKRMLTDLAPHFLERPGIQQQFLELAKTIGLDLPVCLDPQYEILYPQWDRVKDFATCEAAWVEDVRRMAAQWALAPPEKVVGNLARLVSEAASVPRGWPAYSDLLCKRISELIDDPSTWAKAIRNAGLNGIHLLPFLSRLVEMDDKAWLDVEELLDDPKYGGVCLGLALTTPTVPHRLVTKVVARLDASSAETLMGMSIRNDIPRPTLLMLLTHPDRRVAFAVAKGVWLAEPTGVVDEALHEAWGFAVVDGSPETADEHWIRPAFSVDPELLQRWLASQLRRLPNEGLRSLDIIALAAESLGTEDRLTFLGRLANQPPINELIAILIGDDEQAYARFLQQPRSNQEHLIPLAWDLTGSRVDEEAALTPGWIKKAREAVLIGYPAEQVARARLDSPKFWSGEESAAWSSYVLGFETLVAAPDPILNSIGRAGVVLAASRRDEAVARERKEAAYGR